MTKPSKKQSESFLDRVRVPEGGTCRICQGPLDGTPFYVIDYPNGEHVRCWEAALGQIAFPYDTDLREMRALARNLRDAYAALVSYGQWLALMKQGWPQTREQVQAAYRERRAGLAQTLSTLQCRMPNR